MSDGRQRELSVSLCLSDRVDREKLAALSHFLRLGKVEGHRKVTAEAPAVGPQGGSLTVNAAVAWVGALC